MKLTRLFGLLMIGMLVACSPQEAGDNGGGSSESANAGQQNERTFPPAPKGTIRINLGAEPFSLDPNTANDIPSSKVIRHLQEGLIRLDGDAQPKPAVAESWEHDDAYKVWTFHLRDGMTWTNGDPVVAGDFVFALRRILTPATQAQYAQMVFGFLEGGREFYSSNGEDDENFGARAIDDHTLEIRLTAPTPFFPTVVNHPSWYALNRRAVEANGDRWALSADTYVGNGPYILEDWAPKDRIIVTKNPNYYGADEVNFDKIVFRMIESESTALAAFEAGDLDIIDRIPLPEVKRLRETPEWAAPPYLGCYYVCYNVTEPPFDDLALRKAFSLTINRDMIVNKLTRRGETPATGYVPEGIPLPNGKDYREVAPKFIPTGDFAKNLAEAKRILAEAGYGNGKSIPRVSYLYNTADEHKIIAEAMQAVWQVSLGANVDLVNVEWKVKIDRGNTQDYEFMRSGWIGDYLDPMTFLDIFETGGGNNDAGYSNPRYDELLEKARQETNPDKRLEYMIELERILVEEDCVVAPIYFYREPFLIRTDVKDWVRNALGDLDVSRAYRVGET
ncbi:peptide ABC transporter substrate-binding protein [bacterium]|nr:peptide ABC transporter substrate-binding protein [bacterium]